MKNIPKKIYLQVGEMNTDDLKDIDFKQLTQVSWCDKRIYKTDIEFFLSEQSANELTKNNY